MSDKAKTRTLRRVRVPDSRPVDRRSETSARNIAAYIPKPLSDRGTVTVAFRIPTELAEAMDAARGDAKRSEWLRGVLERELAR